MSDVKATYPMPKPSTVGSVLGDLIGKEVTVQEGEPFTLGSENPFTVVLFRDDEGRAGAIMICDIPLCVYAGAALTAMHPDDAKTAAKKNDLDGPMVENFKEVVNIVGGSLFNSPDTPHLVLREIWMNPSKIHIELEPLFTEPGARSDMELDVEEFGSGRMTLLTV